MRGALAKPKAEETPAEEISASTDTAAPEGKTDTKPAGKTSGKKSAEQAAAVDAEGGGVYIPAIELPEKQQEGVAMDMVACVVYRGGIYTGEGYFPGEQAERVDALVGEYIGEAKGNINEWSTQSDYATELAGSVAGSVYTVKGYDPDFRLCIRYEAADGLWILFLDRLNGITIKTGADLFETRLRVGGRVEKIEWQSHENWDWNLGGITEAELPDGLWDEFYSELCRGEFINAWMPDENFYEGVERSMIYDTPNQAHIILTLEDGVVVQLRLIEGGYVQIQQPGWWYFVKMPGEAFDAVYDACGGTHESGWTVAEK